MIAGVSDEDGEFVLLFQCGSAEPGEQEISTGTDTYCVVTAGQGTSYGGVAAASLADGVLRLTFTDAALEPLGLPEADLEVVLDTDPASLHRFGAGLARVLAYGRSSARPVLHGL